MVSIVNPSKICGASATESESSTPPTLTPTGSGRVKVPPVCLDSSLKETAMTTEELSTCTFSTEELVPPKTSEDAAAPKTSVDTASIVSDAIPASSSSSTCTRESDPGAFSDLEGSKHEGTSPIRGITTPLQLDRAVSDRMNASLSVQKTSRQGRATQRWITDADTNQTVRLVTGCVPIMRGGKVLFVSSSRKPEWILPKGGWEQDETMAESAVRECFEEAGVLGILGPKLDVIQYETRKAKKRRLELEEVNKGEGTESSRPDGPKSPAIGSDCSCVSNSNSATAVVWSDDRGCQQTEIVAPVAPSTYSQVRMTLFPLYVSSVVDKWPESGRFRKAVDIDEAIEIVAARPEFRVAIEEVKRRGLHLVPEPQPKRPSLL